MGSPGTPIGQPFGYNDRNELTASNRSDPNMVWAYSYDPIGNRLWSRAADDPNDPNQTYTRNALNQYTRVRLRGTPEQYQTYEYDADGNLTKSWLAADMNCDGVVSFADIDAFLEALYDPNAWHADYPGCNILNGDFNGDGRITFADINPFVALVNAGNSGASLSYVWDAENRLIQVEPMAGTVAVAGAKKAEYAYDYLGRRVWKQVETYDPNATPAWVVTEQRKFVWSGWLLLMELDQNNNVVRKYTWGLDLAGQMGGQSVGPVSDRSMLESAGGIGGLLAVSAPNDPNDPNDDLNYVYTYDANGNVGQLVDLSHDPNDPAGAIVAKYEYDPYGRNLLDPGDPNASGPYGAENPFQYSTKYFDAETGLSYFGGRYYHPGLGRWLNRDPIEELGGANLYAYVGNDPVNWVDYLGRMALPGCPKDGDEPSGLQPPAPPPSQPATPPPGQPPGPRPPEGDEKWRPPKPYGTCKDCVAECNKDDVKKTKALGVTRMEDGKSCYCVCTNIIYEGPWGSLPGLRRADQILEDCANRHEKIHVEKGLGENRPDIDSADCISHGFDECVDADNGLSQAERCRCLNRLKYVLDQNVNCNTKDAAQAECQKKKASSAEFVG